MTSQSEPNKRMIEINDSENLKIWLANPGGAVAVQGVELNGMENELAEVNLAGCLFLGCEMSDALAGFLVSRRAVCLLYTSPSPRDLSTSRMPSSA